MKSRFTLDVLRKGSPINMCFLSIIIPAYNEEKRLPISLPLVIDFIRSQAYQAEVIVVDDGSRDRTADVVRSFLPQADFLRLLPVEHGGKGHAVKSGMLQACGEYRFLCDSDLSMPIEEVNNFLPPLRQDYDIAIGSREAPGSRRYNEPGYRHFTGRVFNTLVRLLAVHTLQDTQAGFKCFHASAADILFPLQTVKGWGFDVELLMIAQHIGMRIQEVPINWYFNGDSRVHLLRDSYRMFSEVWRVRQNLQHGIYRTPPSRHFPQVAAKENSH